jgi:hypothetical protein
MDKIKIRVLRCLKDKSYKVTIRIKFKVNKFYNHYQIKSNYKVNTQKINLIVTLKNLELIKT